jgi:hypothetical protein
MGDDLSMFLAVGSLLHQLLCFEATPSQRLKSTALILGTLIPVSVYHVWADEIYVHEIVFAIMVFLVSRRTRALIKKRVKSEESRKRLGRMATFGICMLMSPSPWRIHLLTKFCSNRSLRLLPLEYRFPPLQLRNCLQTLYWVALGLLV